MAKRWNPRRYGATGFVASIGLSVGIGLLSGTLADSDDLPKLREAQETLAANHARIEETTRNLNRVKQNVGEACLTLLEVYLPGGPLAADTEDTAVRDIMESQDPSCGNTTTKVKVSYRSVSETAKAASSAKGWQAMAAADVKRYEAAYEESDVRKRMVIGGGIGTGVGAIAGAVLTGIALHHNKQHGIDIKLPQPSVR